MMELDGANVVITGGSTGIGLTVVSPGTTDTEMWDRIETGERPFVAVGLQRFRQLAFLPKLTPEGIAAATVDGVEKTKRFVRQPTRDAMYHLPANAPRRLVEASLVGTKFPKDWETTR